MECEVCGKEIYGKKYRVVIDGAKLFACSECAQFATAVWKDTEKTFEKSVSQRSTLTRNIAARFPEDLELVEDFGKRIRTRRVKLKLSHEDLSRKIGAKISVLRKLETGKMIPDQDLAKKLERFLKIKIFQSPLDNSKVEERFVKKAPELTLGDVVVIQKRGADEERDQ